MLVGRGACVVVAQIGNDLEAVVWAGASDTRAQLIHKHRGVFCGRAVGGEVAIGANAGVALIGDHGKCLAGAVLAGGLEGGDAIGHAQAVDILVIEKSDRYRASGPIRSINTGRGEVHDAQLHLRISTIRMDVGFGSVDIGGKSIFSFLCCAKGVVILGAQTRNAKIVVIDHRQAAIGEQG